MITIKKLNNLERNLERFIDSNLFMALLSTGALASVLLLLTGVMSIMIFTNGIGQFIYGDFSSGTIATMYFNGIQIYLNVNKLLLFVIGIIISLYIYLGLKFYLMYKNFNL